MSLESDVRDWTTRGCGLVDGVTLDYIAVHVQQTSKSWPEHASVRVESRRTEDVVVEVLGHVSDIVESAAAEGKNGVALRLKLYRAKGAAGTRTFRQGGPAGSDIEASEDETPKDAMVATIRELRLLATAAVSEQATTAAAGWRLALELVKENAKLTTQLATARVEAQLVKPEEDTTMRAAMDLLPQLPGMLASLVQLHHARQAAAASPVPE